MQNFSVEVSGHVYGHYLSVDFTINKKIKQTFKKYLHIDELQARSKAEDSNGKRSF